MEKYLLTGQQAFTKTTQNHQEVTDDQVKVKVSHLLLSHLDALTYNDDMDVAYPIVPMRLAIGIVTEVGKGVTCFSKGDRVALPATQSCGKCISCKTGHSDRCSAVKMAGRDHDGYLQDFVVLPQSDLIAIPQTMSNEQALCIELVAIAEAIYDKLHLFVGQKVAIIGGGLIANIIAQILHFHKTIPIIIDNNPQNLKMAQANGIPFSFPADDDLDKNIQNATAGTGCSGAVYVLDSKLNPALAIRSMADNKTLILTGYNPTPFTLDVQTIIQRSITVTGVETGYNYTRKAVQLIEQGALNCANFEQITLSNFDVNLVMQDMLAKENRMCKMTILKMIL